MSFGDKGTSVKNRFVADLLTVCSKRVDSKIEIGGGFCVGDIIGNLDSTSYVTGFAGVYIEIGGSLPAFRAMLAKTKDNPLRTATFAMKKYGLQDSWMKAVRERALYVGYKGHIPEIPPPAISDIERHCRLKKGVIWMKDNDIPSMLIEASKPKPTK